MAAVRSLSRPVLLAVVLTTTGLTATACGGEDASVKAETAPSTLREGPAWEEPSSYAYTLMSSQGERALIGTFRVTVRDGAVVKAVGLDASGRQVVKRTPDAVPTLGALLRQLEQARADDADTAEAEYAPDGHPVRIELDWEKNAIDDEALYVVSAYEPADS